MYEDRSFWLLWVRVNKIISKLVTNGRFKTRYERSAEKTELCFLCGQHHILSDIFYVANLAILGR
jgi:hypothetical protein